MRSLPLTLALMLATSPFAAWAEAPQLGDPVDETPVTNSGPADVVAQQAARLGLGDITTAATVGNVLYVGLQKGGVAVIDTDAEPAKLVRMILDGQFVQQLVVHNGQLTAFIVSESVSRFDITSPLQPVRTGPLSGAPVSVDVVAPPPSAIVDDAPTKEPAKEPKRTINDKKVQGVVSAVTEGRVIVDFGEQSGTVVRGDRVRIISQRMVQKPDLKTGASTMQPSNEVTAVVTIEEVSEGRAMAMLGRGDVALIGDIVEETTLPLSESLFLPRRAPFNWRAGFVVRPFLGIGSSGFPVGALADGYLHYTFDDLPLSVFAEVAPIGSAILTRDVHFPTSIALGATYTTDFVEIGLGGGVQFGNAGPCQEEFDFSNGQTRSLGFVCTPNVGPTFNQVLRLGALDGVHLKWASSIAAYSTGFIFGGARAEVAVPVSSRFGVFAGGGGGANKWGYGEIGVRTFFGGTGAPGTLMLQTSLGGAGFFDGPRSEAVGGPSVSFGLEWRI